jgi:hypothetical protein
MDFKRTPAAAATREILLMQKDLGGQLGELRFGGQVLAGVLRVEENVYVTEQPVSKSWHAIAAFDQADVHQIKNGADALQFRQRLGEYRRG